MERMPQELHEVPAPLLPVQPAQIGSAADWRRGLPTLTGARVALRELRLDDATALCAAMSTGDVTQFLSPPPTSIVGFERFIEWALRQRAVGQYVCFAVTPRGSDQAIGL